MRKHRRKTQPALPGRVKMGDPHRSFPDSPILSPLTSRLRRSIVLRPKTAISVCQNAERESAADWLNHAIATNKTLFTPSELNHDHDHVSRRNHDLPASSQTDPPAETTMQARIPFHSP